MTVEMLEQDEVTDFFVDLEQNPACNAVYCRFGNPDAKWRVKVKTDCGHSDGQFLMCAGCMDIMKNLEGTYVCPICKGYIGGAMDMIVSIDPL